jgi:adenylate kinase
MNSKKSTKNLILIGPPGSGKGTQAENIKKQWNLLHLSTGDLLRAQVKGNTSLGQTAKKYMESGELVPDELIIQILKEALPIEGGFILDGFPRTIAQAQQLEKMLKDIGLTIDVVLEFNVEDQRLINRILGRLVHPASGRSYHTEFNPPKVPWKDDVTGEPLVKRSDDTEEALITRLASYHQMTAPVLDFYRTKSLLTVIDGSKPPSQVWSEVQSALKH